jgi:murein DD-endopeptidase MepM/ murein hydrolase activator NlpD
MRLGFTRADAPSGSKTRHRSRRVLLFLLLLIPLVSGSFAAPSSPAAGDELADARARQKALQQQIADQKAEMAELTELQGRLQSDIAVTAYQLQGINADLVVVRSRVATMVTRVNSVRIKYEGLVRHLAALDQQLVLIQIQEKVKQDKLVERKALLAARLRDAYDTDRTSLLETFLSGDSFTDMLSQVSYYLDIGEQDRELAEQIIHDQETLQVIHENLDDTRVATNDFRKQTAAKRKELNSQLGELRQAQAALKVLERKTAHVLAAQKASFAQVAHNKAALRAAVARSARAQKALSAKIGKIIAEQARRGRIPSQYNGTLHWPMNGTVSQEFGCTGFAWEPPFGDCPHFHQGIDIVAPYGTPVKASGDGVVAFVGWNPYDSPSDPAWIVIIAHSTSLETWYAHMQPRMPVRAGERVKAGQTIGYEGNTGNSTGAHLHWAVRLNGTFVNPRLFL